MSGDSRYVVWRNKAVPNGCSVTDFAGLEDEWPLRSGQPYGDAAPDGLSFSMDANFPYDTLLTDSLLNTQMLLVCSSRLVAYLQARGVPEIEYLPTTILDHRGRPVDDAYQIVHPTNPIECIDVDASAPTFSTITPTLINRVESLVLEEDRIPADRLLFRAANLPRATLVGRELMEGLQSEGFTGVGWCETVSFKY